MQGLFLLKFTKTNIIKSAVRPPTNSGSKIFYFVLFFLLLCHIRPRSVVSTSAEIKHDRGSATNRRKAGEGGKVGRPEAKARKPENRVAGVGVMFVKWHGLNLCFK